MYKGVQSLGCTLNQTGAPSFLSAKAARMKQALGKSRTADVVDAVLVTTAVPHKAVTLTSGPDDIQRLVRAPGREVAIIGT